MVDFGKLTRKARGLADQHGDKIAKGVDKVTDVIDDRTKGKHRDKLAKVDEAAAKLDKTEPRTDPKPKPGTEARAEPSGPSTARGGDGPAA